MMLLFVSANTLKDLQQDTHGRVILGATIE